MALYLVQHGRSLPKEKDPEQGLSGEGIAEVERIAGVGAGIRGQGLADSPTAKRKRAFSNRRDLFKSIESRIRAPGNERFESAG